MKFTGRNLQLVRSALDLSLDDIRNQIVTCPDPGAYPAELAELEAMEAEVKSLLKKVDQARGVTL